ncbi:phytanoyl-CoA dioxygenase family protein [Hymenobacter koreensis]|uniref:Phytanoyl-CoA dioxygenase family protein n=1 Tax=Hymenobacter koreensis TaxID=1084523 RepID=A0ABP8J1A1_9BACT
MSQLHAFFQNKSSSSDEERTPQLLAEAGVVVSSAQSGGIELGSTNKNLQRYQEDGFTVVETVYTASEISAMLAAIEQAESQGGNFRRTTDLFAIRNLMQEVPELLPLIWNRRFTDLLHALLPAPYHLVKAIYFDKPPQSNWVVAWHQDLMVAVDRRADVPGFGPWNARPEGVNVQPTREYLENICTLRIHLDACDAGNGALRAVPGSHLHGAIPATELSAYTPGAVVCDAPAGGVMLMKPLTLHASHRSTDARPRRVIHLEFSSLTLPAGLRWREALPALESAFSG